MDSDDVVWLSKELTTSDRSTFFLIHGASKIGFGTQIELGIIALRVFAGDTVRLRVWPGCYSLSQLSDHNDSLLLLSCFEGESHGHLDVQRHQKIVCKSEKEKLTRKHPVIQAQIVEHDV